MVRVKLLALASRRIASAQSGYDLRVAHLCEQLPGERHLMIVPLSARDKLPETIDAGEIFTTVRETGPLLTPRSWRRHLRLSDDNYLRRSQPAAFATAVRDIRECIRENKITHVVVFGGDLVEFAAAVKGCDVLLDVCDSRSLTAHRQLLWASEPPVGWRKLKAQLELFRVRATESRLPDRFRCVTTISEPDRRQLLDLHGPANNVHVVPNGVGDGLLEPLGPRGTRRGVAFWGNLAFGPNDEALRFFVDKVYLPFLVAHDVELYVAGASAPLWLMRTAERMPRITVAGFVPDLAAAVGEYPLMINPMRTGSGLKNKVLEAFGLGLVVLTTRLGVDALPAVRDDEHLVMADEPEAMSRAVLDLLADDVRRERLRDNANSLLRSNYPWAVIGREWRALLRAAEPHPDPAPRGKVPSR
jgi:glycosyltransferase involved in cell wall biosynthesis